MAAKATTKTVPNKMQEALKNPSPLRVGNAVLIRTVTYFQLGRIVAFDAWEIVLEEASWIADTGRFSTALRSGVLNEVEPFVGAVSVARGAVIDITSWTHDLPKEQK
jgi:hypothetical protein